MFVKKMFNGKITPFQMIQRSSHIIVDFRKKKVVDERTKDQGLTDTVVYSISEDRDGSIWGGTENGISVPDDNNRTTPDLIVVIGLVVTIGI